MRDNDRLSQERAEQYEAPRFGAFPRRCSIRVLIALGGYLLFQSGMLQAAYQIALRQVPIEQYPQYTMAGISLIGTASGLPELVEQS